MATTDANQLVPVDQAMQEFRASLGKLHEKRLKMLLGNFMPYERFCGAILTYCEQNPRLLDTRYCTRASLVMAVLRIAQLQLSPDPSLGQAWIVPRKGVATFQMGWKGCLQLAYRHPAVRAVRFGVVGKEDYFEWKDGKSFILEHIASENGWPEKLADVRACWSVIDLNSGGQVPRVMWLPEILRHKRRGETKDKAGNYIEQPAWVTDGPAMALKTTIADCCRRGPMEGEIGKAFYLDHMAEIGQGQPVDETIAAEFAVVEGDQRPAEKKGNLAKFKAAHRPPSEENSTGPEGSSSGLEEPPDGPVVDLSGSEDIEVSPPAVGSPKADNPVSRAGGGESLEQGGEVPFTSDNSEPTAPLAPSAIISTASVPVTDAAPEVAQEPPGPRLLSPARVAELKKFCAQSGKSVDEMESRFGPLDELSADQDGAVVSWIKALAIKAKGRRS